MKNIYNIRFTEYSSHKSVLHIDDKRHFIIGNAQRDLIDEIFSSNNEKLKESLYKELCLFKKNKNAFSGLQDFQIKLTMIPKSIMELISVPFSKLFNIYIFSVIFPLLIIMGSYFFFFKRYPFMSQTFTIGLSWIVIPIMAIFHEIGHASACKKYGASVSDVGIGIASFRPVMFANVSGAWYLPKLARILVNLGGIYFQMIYAIILYIISIKLQSASLFYSCKAIFISVIFQFYPFFRSDGYWMVSDILNEPNLYKNAKDVFVKKVSDIKLLLTGKEKILLTYYILFETVILTSIVVMVIKFYSYIISLPIFIIKEFYLAVKGNINGMLMVDIKYIWSILFLSIIVKYIAKNIKKTFAQKGLGKCKQTSPNK